MDAATFERELGKYRRVRDWSFNDQSSWSAQFKARTTTAAKGAAIHGGTTDTATDAAAAGSTAASRAALPEDSLVYADFWAGLDAVLAIHIPDAKQRARVTKSFDALHYRLLRDEMNLEDMERLAGLLVPSGGGEAPAPAPT